MERHEQSEELDEVSQTPVTKKETVSSEESDVFTSKIIARKPQEEESGSPEKPNVSPLKSPKQRQQQSHEQCDNQEPEAFSTEEQIVLQTEEIHGTYKHFTDYSQKQCEVQMDIVPDSRVVKKITDHRDLSLFSVSDVSPQTPETARATQPLEFEEVLSEPEPVSAMQACPNVSMSSSTLTKDDEASRPTDSKRSHSMSFASDQLTQHSEKASLKHTFSESDKSTVTTSNIDLALPRKHTPIERPLTGQLVISEESRSGSTTAETGNHILKHWADIEQSKNEESETLETSSGHAVDPNTKIQYPVCEKSDMEGNEASFLDGQQSSLSEYVESSGVLQSPSVDYQLPADELLSEREETCREDCALSQPVQTVKKRAPEDGTLNQLSQLDLGISELTPDLFQSCSDLENIFGDSESGQASTDPVQWRNLDSKASSQFHMVLKQECTTSSVMEDFTSQISAHQYEGDMERHEQSEELDEVSQTPVTKKETFSSEESDVFTSKMIARKPQEEESGSPEKPNVSPVKSPKQRQQQSHEQCDNQEPEVFSVEKQIVLQTEEIHGTYKHFTDYSQKQFEVQMDIVPDSRVVKKITDHRDLSLFSVSDVSPQTPETARATHHFEFEEVLSEPEPVSAMQACPNVSMSSSTLIKDDEASRPSDSKRSHSMSFASDQLTQHSEKASLKHTFSESDKSTVTTSNIDLALPRKHTPIERPLTGQLVISEESRSGSTTAETGNHILKHWADIEQSKNEESETLETSSGHAVDPNTKIQYPVCEKSDMEGNEASFLDGQQSSLSEYVESSGVLQSPPVDYQLPADELLSEREETCREDCALSQPVQTVKKRAPEDGTLNQLSQLDLGISELTPDLFQSCSDLENMFGDSESGQASTDPVQWRNLDSKASSQFHMVLKQECTTSSVMEDFTSQISAHQYEGDMERHEQSEELDEVSQTPVTKKETFSSEESDVFTSKMIARKSQEEESGSPEKPNVSPLISPKQRQQQSHEQCDHKEPEVFSVEEQIVLQTEEIHGTYKHFTDYSQKQCEVQMDIVPDSRVVKKITDHRDLSLFSVSDVSPQTPETARATRPLEFEEVLSEPEPVSDVQTCPNVSMSSSTLTKDDEASRPSDSKRSHSMSFASDQLTQHSEKASLKHTFSESDKSTVTTSNIDLALPRKHTPVERPLTGQLVISEESRPGSTTTETGNHILKHWANNEQSKNEESETLETSSGHAVDPNTKIQYPVCEKSDMEGSEASFLDGQQSSLSEYVESSGVLQSPSVDYQLPADGLLSDSGETFSKDCAHSQPVQILEKDTPKDGSLNQLSSLHHGISEVTPDLFQSCSDLDHMFDDSESGQASTDPVQWRNLDSKASSQFHMVLKQECTTSSVMEDLTSQISAHQYEGDMEIHEQSEELDEVSQTPVTNKETVSSEESDVFTSKMITRKPQEEESGSPEKPNVSPLKSPKQRQQQSHEQCDNQEPEVFSVEEPIVLQTEEIHGTYKHFTDYSQKQFEVQMDIVPDSRVVNKITDHRDLSLFSVSDVSPQTARATQPREFEEVLSEPEPVSAMQTCPNVSVSSSTLTKDDEASRPSDSKRSHSMSFASDQLTQHSEKASLKHTFSESDKSTVTTSNIDLALPRKHTPVERPLTGQLVISEESRQGSIAAETGNHILKHWANKEQSKNEESDILEGSSGHAVDPNTKIQYPMCEKSDMEGSEASFLDGQQSSLSEYVESSGVLQSPSVDYQLPPDRLFSDSGETFSEYYTLSPLVQILEKDTPETRMTVKPPAQRDQDTLEVTVDFIRTSSDSDPIGVYPKSDELSNDPIQLRELKSKSSTQSLMMLKQECSSSSVREDRTLQDSSNHYEHAIEKQDQSEQFYEFSQISGTKTQMTSLEELNVFTSELIARKPQEEESGSPEKPNVSPVKSPKQRPQQSHEQCDNQEPEVFSVEEKIVLQTEEIHGTYKHFTDYSQKQCEVQMDIVPDSRVVKKITDHRDLSLFSVSDVSPQTPETARATHHFEFEEVLSEPEPVSAMQACPNVSMSSSTLTKDDEASRPSDSKRSHSMSFASDQLTQHSEKASRKHTFSESDKSTVTTSNIDLALPRKHTPIERPLTGQLVISEESRSGSTTAETGNHILKHWADIEQSKNEESETLEKSSGHAVDPNTKIQYPVCEKSDMEGSEATFLDGQQSSLSEYVESSGVLQSPPVDYQLPADELLSEREEMCREDCALSLPVQTLKKRAPEDGTLNQLSQLDLGISEVTPDLFQSCSDLDHMFGDSESGQASTDPVQWRNLDSKASSQFHMVLKQECTTSSVKEDFTSQISAHQYEGDMERHEQSEELDEVSQTPVTKKETVSSEESDVFTSKMITRKPQEEESGSPEKPNVSPLKSPKQRQQQSHEQCDHQEPEVFSTEEQIVLQTEEIHGTYKHFTDYSQKQCEVQMDIVPDSRVVKKITDHRDLSLFSVSDLSPQTPETARATHHFEFEEVLSEPEPVSAMQTCPNVSMSSSTLTKDDEASRPSDSKRSHSMSFASDQLTQHSEKASRKHTFSESDKSTVTTSNIDLALPRKHTPVERPLTGQLVISEESRPGSITAETGNHILKHWANIEQFKNEESETLERSSDHAVDSSKKMHKKSFELHSDVRIPEQCEPEIFFECQQTMSEFSQPKQDATDETVSADTTSPCIYDLKLLSHSPSSSGNLNSEFHQSSGSEDYEDAPVIQEPTAESHDHENRHIKKSSLPFTYGLLAETSHGEAPRDDGDDDDDDGDWWRVEEVPDINLHTKTEEQEDLVVKKILQSADAVETEDFRVGGSPGQPRTAADGGAHSNMGKRTVVRSEGDHTHIEVTFCESASRKDVDSQEASQTMQVQEASQTMQVQEVSQTMQGQEVSQTMQGQEVSLLEKHLEDPDLDLPTD
ncbi:uncharacterized protein ank2a isoform X6 [Brachyhypopomus gauderio]|uniref:uncharacterized protein ank2a isoform X6 n=1 Tax=Brachyhypopomus gauderio TaxID=698409 RepID=UPI004042A87E